MVKRLLQRFPAYKELEKIIWQKDEALDLAAATITAYRAESAALRKKAESDAAVIASLSRYIDALEGRDKERVRRIGELERLCNKLERLCRENLEYIKELERQLSDITPLGEIF